MKAIVKKEDGPGLILEELPKPKIGTHDLLIKIKKTSICGTDTHIYKWDTWAKKNVPLGTTIGHEFFGEVAEIGSEVTQFRVGDRVSGEGHIVCGQCRNCRTGKPHLCPLTKVIGIHQNGCFADDLAFPEKNTFLIPDNISDEIASLLDPLGNAIHTALSFDLAGEDVLITGAGPIGIMAASIARQAGARHVVITDISDYRLNLAKNLGATAIVNVSKENLKEVIASLGIREGFTIGLEMSGAPSALNTLLEELSPGGKIALLGILPPNVVIDWDLVIFKMLEIKGIFGREIFSTWYKMVHMLQAGLPIKPLITHRFDAEDFEEAFQIFMSGQSGRIILNW